MKGLPGGRFLTNLAWLVVLVLLIAATVVVWKKSDELFLPSRETAVVKVFREASPAVVNLTVEPLPESPYGVGPRGFSPWSNDFLRQFFGLREEAAKFDLGSGIIVDPRGYILTNEHVVANSSSIQVKLADGRTVTGEVWGTEPSLDLAVVKVELADPLPYLEMGESDDLMIGEEAIVIGNPLGLGHTCTTGIISALHRQVAVNNRVYSDLIQVDAAVNPGNSGGPLLNIRGSLVGITSALTSEAQGIGFAIPVNLARKVVEDLILYRYVPTGWLGISVEGLRDAAEAFSLPGVEGVFISRIEEDSPAAESLRAGDIIEAWGDTTIRNVEDFVARARRLRPGDEVTLTRVRDKDREQARVKIGAFPEALAEEWAWYHLGLRVLATKYRDRAPDGRILIREGVFVQEVAPESPAQAAGLIPGDLVVNLNREELGSLANFQKAIVRLRQRENIFIRFQRRRITLFVTVPFRVSGERW